MKKSAPNTPAVLLILDGWGIGPKAEGNAILSARTPHLDTYRKRYAYAELKAASTSVGLPVGQAGNSEAGHMNIGAGRIVEQDSVTISRSISDGTFFKNPAFLQSVKHAKKHNADVHLMGLLSNGQSAHSHPDHLIALIMFYHQHKVKNIFLHLFTDGRDSQRYSALKLLRKYQSVFSTYATVASLIGRAYAMDRKKDWKHTERTYNTIVLGTATRYASSAEDAIVHAYNCGETDEFIVPTVIRKNGKPVAKVNNKDVVVFFNLRSDRARQLAKPFVQTRFEAENSGGFKRRKTLKHLFFVAMTDFGPDLENILTAFPSRDVADTLPYALRSMRQLYIAESEKYAHITFFFNGGYAKPIAGEHRYHVPSPDILSYESTPKMGLPAIAKHILSSLNENSYDFIAANISNADMLAHTGDIEATIKACEFVDATIGQIVDVVLAKNGIVFITADHGNAEELINRRTHEIDTEHSKCVIPFFLVKQGSKVHIRSRGSLADVAPTILQMLKIKKPTVMTGKSLIA